MKSYNKTILFLVMFINISCIREETIQPINIKEETKPVVLCFITPGDSIRAYISQTRPIASNSDSAQSSFNGIASISDSLGSTIYLHKSKNNTTMYVASQKNLAIECGKSYTFVVSDKNKQVFTAITRVPLQRDMFSKAQLIGTRNEDDGTWYEVKLEWKKRSLTKNIIGTQYDSINASMDADIQPSVINDSLYSYFSVEGKREQYHYFLLTINEPFNEYLKSYQPFVDFNTLMQTKGGDNYFRGVVPQYTNFDKCFGVFGAYLKDTISVKNYLLHKEENTLH